MYSCVCNDDAEVADVFEQQMRTARKAHRCCECGDAIQPGERYEYIASLFDGSWHHYKTCRTCAEIAKTFQAGGRDPTALWEDIHNVNCFANDWTEEHFCICPGGETDGD